MKDKGFTLVELLAVILILSIILIISVYSINGIISRARVDNDVNLVRQILHAGESFHGEIMGNRRMQADPEIGYAAADINSTSVANQFNSYTNNFFTNCDLPRLNTENFNESHSGFSRSLQEIRFTPNNNQAVWVIDIKSLIDHGFLRRSILEDPNGSDYKVNFNSCPPARVVILVTGSNLLSFEAINEDSVNFTYTIARRN